MEVVASITSSSICCLALGVCLLFPSPKMRLPRGLFNRRVPESEMHNAEEEAKEGSGKKERKLERSPPERRL